FSFRSPLGILTHIGNVEHTWCGVIDGGQPDWRNPPYSTKELHTVEPVISFLEETRARTHELVDHLSEKELQRAIQLEDASWLVKDELTIEELLWIVFTHEQWHRGELIAAFWSQDIEPPRLDWHQYDTPVGGFLPS
ncbi:MAG: DinB family protein, partial [Candidatus Thermoplasmatota archaeon]|nr:DinB family protein [Candidatus Thermoplasmatota archaeon]